MMPAPHSSKSLLQLRKLLDTANLAELGPARRNGTLPQPKLTHDIDAITRDGNLPERNRDLIRGVLLLWHDHLNAAHEIAQAIEDGDGSLLHAMMHRREPDYGNAKYWLRRAGQHACYPTVGREVVARIGSNFPKLIARLVLNGVWDPYAFVDVCAGAARRSFPSEEIKALQEIQHTEFGVFLEHLAVA